MTFLRTLDTVFVNSNPSFTQFRHLRIRTAMTKAYDPLDYENLARSVVTALLESVSTALPPTEKFSGSGVYALYTGTLPR